MARSGRAPAGRRFSPHSSMRHVLGELRMVSDTIRNSACQPTRNARRARGAAGSSRRGWFGRRSRCACALGTRAGASWRRLLAAIPSWVQPDEAERPLEIELGRPSGSSCRHELPREMIGESCVWFPPNLGRERIEGMVGSNPRCGFARTPQVSSCRHELVRRGLRAGRFNRLKCARSTN